MKDSESEQRPATFDRFLRAAPRAVPRGRARISWYGPALLWMVSAVGSGSVLFTPRIAARYEYSLLWIALFTCLCMWIMIREAARYTTVSGRTLLDGFNRVPGPQGWALWVIFLPQLVAAVVGIAGLCALIGSAAQVSMGGPHALYTVGTIVGATTLVVLGEYDVVERLSRYMAAQLVVLSAAAAFQVRPEPGVLAAGLVPRLPADFDLGFVSLHVGKFPMVWMSRAIWLASSRASGAYSASGV